MNEGLRLKNVPHFATGLFEISPYAGELWLLRNSTYNIELRLTEEGMDDLLALLTEAKKYTAEKGKE